MESDNPVARAFVLARSGNCRDMKDLRAQLRNEGFAGIDAHLQGQSIRRQLQAILKQQDQSSEES